MQSPHRQVSLYAAALAATLLSCSGTAFQTGNACETGSAACPSSLAGASGAPTNAGASSGGVTGGGSASSAGEAGTAGSPVAGSATSGMGGSSGAGGSADVPSAPTGEALARGDWHVSASNTYFPNTMADYAVDDDRTSCWASGTGQAPGMWFLVDLRAPQFFFEIELLTLAGSTDYPRRLRVSTSTDGKTFSAAANDIAGSTETHVSFDEAKYARYIKLELTHDAGGLWWRIDDLQVRK